MSESGNMDIYEPLERFRDEFREKFTRLAEEAFEEYHSRSGVSEEENRRLVTHIRGVEKLKDAAVSRKSLAGLGMVFCFLLFAVAVYLFLDLIGCWKNSGGIIPEEYRGWGLGGSCIGGLLSVVGFFKLLGRFRNAVKDIAKYQAMIEKWMAEAWAQMEPLNGLYEWDITARLMERAVPRLEFDPFFTEARLAELRKNFGWDDSFHLDKSILGAQSGEINGSPFVLADFLQMFWGEKTYTGYKTIYWTTVEQDANGRSRRVSHSETLSASVTMPYPEYQKRSIVLFGNDAAPNLTFTREPSGFAGTEKGLGRKLQERSVRKKLEKFSRNLEDDSQYTMMSNVDFEVLFDTMNRNHEVEYRLLFTALAQRQMTALLEDTEVGYGDDFVFVKDHKMNMILPKHLDLFSLDTDPAQYRNYDLEDARKKFISRNVEYFRQVYFSLAPLLCIPLYQQTATHEKIYGDVLSRQTSFWEHEALANFHGEKTFAHPDSVTQNILKTEVCRRDAGVLDVKVTAYGYRGVPRVTVKSVFGGDGRYHDVHVEWVEYLPVQGEGMFVAQEAVEEREKAEEKERLEERRRSLYRGNWYRRNAIYSYVKR